MRSYLVHLVITLSFVQLSFQYRSYPRRNTRDHSSLGVCPSQCRCMNLNQRTVRGLFDSWNIGKSWQSTEPNESGRSVVCQGLRELPSDIPSGKFLNLNNMSSTSPLLSRLITLWLNDMKSTTRNALSP